MGMLIGASLGCSFGYVLGAIMHTAKQADIIGPNLQSPQLEQAEREPELPLGHDKICRVSSGRLLRQTRHLLGV
jgi:hypothetical protein